jgi:hypothetical protein
MAGLAEMAALGAEISLQVNAEMMREMPAIMEEVRQSLKQAGIDPDNMDAWQNSTGFDAEDCARRFVKLRRR